MRVNRIVALSRCLDGITYEDLRRTADRASYGSDEEWKAAEAEAKSKTHEYYLALDWPEGDEFTLTELAGFFARMSGALGEYEQERGLPRGEDSFFYELIDVPDGEESSS